MNGAPLDGSGAGRLVAGRHGTRNRPRSDNLRPVRYAQIAQKPDACGPRTKKPNGKPWRCTFADDFAGKKLAKHWVIHPDKRPEGRGRGLPQAQERQGGPRAAPVERAQHRPGHGCRFAVGSVTTYHKFSQKYGRFQARIKARGTKERGLQEAFWMWPDDRFNKEKKYPASGEIDISETYSQFPDLSVPYLHYPRQRGDPGPQTAQTARPSAGGGTSTRCCGPRSGSRSRSTARPAWSTPRATARSRSGTSSP